jgi:hypothetical protein
MDGSVSSLSDSSVYTEIEQRDGAEEVLFLAKSSSLSSRLLLKMEADLAAPDSVFEGRDSKTSLVGDLKYALNTSKVLLTMVSD